MIVKSNTVIEYLYLSIVVCYEAHIFQKHKLFAAKLIIIKRYRHPEEFSYTHSPMLQILWYYYEGNFSGMVHHKPSNNNVYVT